MKCRYKFSVEGKLRTTSTHPISVRGLEYEFLSNEYGVITGVSVMTGKIDKRSWPQIKESNTPGVKLDVHIPSEPNLKNILEELSVIEGLLSLHGLQKINYEHFDVEWLPENEAEKNELKLSAYSTGVQEIEDSDLHVLPFDLLARPVVGAQLGKKSEVALSFYRKGRIDVTKERFIEAIYDFYFVLESTYGDGKFKKSQVVQSFTESSELSAIIDEVLKNPSVVISKDKRLSSLFNRKYRGKTVQQAVSDIVDLRGFLHHHTTKRPDIWHPEKHKEYELDALLLQEICFNVAFKAYEDVIFNNQTIAKYKSIFAGHSNL